MAIHGLFSIPQWRWSPIDGRGLAELQHDGGCCSHEGSGVIIGTASFSDLKECLAVSILDTAGSAISARQACMFASSKLPWAEENQPLSKGPSSIPTKMKQVIHFVWLNKLANLVLLPTDHKMDSGSILAWTALVNCLLSITTNNTISQLSYFIPL